MSLGVISLPCSLSRMVEFDFPVGPGLIQMQVLDHPSSVRHGFHLMGWLLNPIKKCLVTPTIFVPLLPPLYYVDRSPL